MIFFPDDKMDSESEHIFGHVDLPFFLMMILGLMWNHLRIITSFLDGLIMSLLDHVT